MAALTPPLTTSLFDLGGPPPCPEPFNAAAYCLSAAARAHPDKTALIVVRDAASLSAEEHWTFGQLDGAVRRLAKGLQNIGLRPGQRVMLRLDNTSLFPLTFFATLAAGGIAVPTSALLTPGEARFVAEDCGARFLCLADDLPLDGGQNDAWLDGCRTLSETDLRHMMAVETPADYAPTQPDTPAYIVYTSGATATPKGVLHAHRAVWARTMMYDGWYGLRADDRMLHAGALNWTYTLGAGLMDPWAVGAGTVIYNGAKDPGVWPRLAAHHRATLFAAVPGVFRQLLKHAEGLKAGFATVRHGLTAGEKLPEELLAQWTTITQKPLFEALGMSECSTYVSSSPTVAVKSGRSGRPQPGRRVAVLDADAPSAQTVGIDQPGLLAIHKDDPGLMVRYWNRAPETRAAFRGRWFVTGDLATMDGDGYIHYLGRADDIMNAQGYRVAPQEIEELLIGHPNVNDCACAEISVRPGVSIITAFVVSPNSATPNTEHLTRHLGKRLAPYKVPKAFVFVDALPRTPTGKVARRELAKLPVQPLKRL